MFGLLSGASKVPERALEMMAQGGVCRCCKGRGDPVPCAYISANTNGSCLFCMITGSNAHIRDGMCSQCNGVYEDATSNRDNRQSLFRILLEPLMYKLRFTTPAFTLKFGAEVSAHLTRAS